jgi:hypothetical protein
MKIIPYTKIKNPVRKLKLYKNMLNKKNVFQTVNGLNIIFSFLVVRFSTL